MFGLVIQGKVKCSEKEWNKLTSLITIPFYSILHNLFHPTIQIQIYHHVFLNPDKLCVCVYSSLRLLNKILFLVCTGGIPLTQNKIFS